MNSAVLVLWHVALVADKQREVLVEIKHLKKLAVVFALGLGKRQSNLLALRRGEVPGVDLLPFVLDEPCVGVGGRRDEHHSSGLRRGIY